MYGFDNKVNILDSDGEIFPHISTASSVRGNFLFKFMFSQRNVGKNLMQVEDELWIFSKLIY